MPFQPDVLTEKTLKGFVDKLVRLRKSTPIPTPATWPPKRHECQEELAQVLGFPNWHAAITAVTAVREPAGLVPVTTSSATSLMYPHEPAPMADFDHADFLAWATREDVSDITLQTGENIIVDRWGNRYRCTKRTLDKAAMDAFLHYLWTGQQTSQWAASDLTMPNMNQGYVDFAFQAPMSPTERMRFMVYANTIYYDGKAGMQVTMRRVPTAAPVIESLNIEPALMEAFNPQPGLVLVGGSTGGGKSTLLAALMGHCAQLPEAHSITTLESPIEFVLVAPKGSNSLITQIDSGRVPLAGAVRQACQRRSAIVMMGALRDVGAIEEALNAATAKACVYASSNSNGVPDMLRRMVSCFPQEDRNARFEELLFATRVLVAQRLVSTPQGTRVALREFLVLNDTRRNTLLNGGIDHIQATCLSLLDQRTEGSQTFLEDARVKREQGLMMDKEWQMIYRAHQAQRKNR